MTLISHQPRFAQSSIPFSVNFQRRELLNRLFIEAVGYDPWMVVCARNKFERLEKALDVVSWFLIGVLGPIGLDKGINRLYSNYLIKKFDLPKAARPLDINMSGLDSAIGIKTLSKLPEAAKKSLGLSELLLKPSSKLKDCLVSIRHAKLGIILLDLMLIGVYGQGMFLFRNWMTERLAKKKGFSGEFNYASKEYREKQSTEFAKHEKMRQWGSIGLSILCAVGLPLALWGVLKSKSTTGILGKLKPWADKFNYEKTIYMGKWVLFWGCLMNYNVPSLAFSRDKHEFRESLTKALALDFFYFVGDEMIAGGLAYAIQRFSKTGQDLLKKGIPLYHWQGKGPFKLPIAVSASPMFDKYGAKHIAYKMARNIFWAGLVGTSALLGVVTPLVNNYYTKKKVLAEQAELEKTKQASRKRVSPNKNTPLTQPYWQQPQWHTTPVITNRQYQPN